jgi:hypothetical protein
MKRRKGKEMTTDFITTKVTPKGLELLREISALTGEKQYRVLERVLAKEMRQIARSGDKPGDNDQ